MSKGGKGYTTANFVQFNSEKLDKDSGLTVLRWSKPKKRYLNLIV